MNKTTKSQIFWTIAACVLGISFFYFISRDIDTAPTNDVTTTEVTTNTFADLTGDTTKTLPGSIRLAGTPFTSQAPFGGWEDPRQQDGCEEASILMASLWAKGTPSISKDNALKEILALSAKAEEMFGTFHDSSAEDTLKLYHAYFDLDGEVKSNPTAEDIKAALAEGKLVAAPSDGRKLGNPNFSGEGPDRHFLVIIGYNDKKKVFITNDPGTRNGAGYEYSYDTLMGSLLNYPTGDHKPLFKTDTAIVIFAKQA